MLLLLHHNLITVCTLWCKNLFLFTPCPQSWILRVTVKVFVLKLFIVPNYYFFVIFLTCETAQTFLQAKAL